MNLQLIEETINLHVPEVRVRSFSPMTGGCINECYKVNGHHQEFFIKFNTNQDLLLKEVDGLKLLTPHIQTPMIIGFGKKNDIAYLILSFISTARASRQFWEKLGQSLAHLHGQSASDYGLGHDNYIGSLPQSNKKSSSWIEFFVLQRLKPQIDCALQANLLGSPDVKQFETLFNKFDTLLPIESPSLLHGDLWSGNFLCGSHHQPVLIDPAVYYGHREMEIAFTRLFGGFDSIFYNSYQETKPLLPAFEERIDIYNLYPLLVHLNLFGASYYGQIKNILKQFA